MELGYKIDFLGLVGVSLANPNGDPLNGGRPRLDSSSHGIITDVCLKRKLRDRLSESGEHILVSPQRDSTDSLEQRLSPYRSLSDEELVTEACSRWYDVRAFGQVFFGVGRQASRSASVRGAVSIQHAVSVHPVEVLDLPITRCVNGKGTAGRGHDTLGRKSVVRYGLYLLKGSVCGGVAQKNGFTEEDAYKLRSALAGIFTNDASAARPEGSMVMERLYWWRHNTLTGDHSTARVHDTIKLSLRAGCGVPHSFSDYVVEEQHLNGITPEIIC